MRVPALMPSVGFKELSCRGPLCSALYNSARQDKLNLAQHLNAVSEMTFYRNPCISMAAAAE